MWESNKIVFVLSSNRLLWNFYGLIIHQNTDSVTKTTTYLTNKYSEPKIPQNSEIILKTGIYCLINVWIWYFDGVFDSLTHTNDVIFYNKWRSNLIWRKNFFRCNLCPLKYLSTFAKQERRQSECVSLS